MNRSTFLFFAIQSLLLLAILIQNLSLNQSVNRLEKIVSLSNDNSAQINRTSTLNTNTFAKNAQARLTVAEYDNVTASSAEDMANNSQTMTSAMHSAMQKTIQTTIDASIKNALQNVEAFKHAQETSGYATADTSDAFNSPEYFQAEQQVAVYIDKGRISDNEFMALSQQLVRLNPDVRQKLLTRLARELNRQ